MAVLVFPQPVGPASQMTVGTGLEVERAFSRKTLSKPCEYLTAKEALCATRSAKVLHELIASWMSLRAPDPDFLVGKEGVPKL